MSDVKVYKIFLCDDCIEGAGEECHTPGCTLYLHSVDIPIGKELLEPFDSYALQDVALDVLAKGIMEIAEDENTCKNCIVYKKKMCTNLNMDKCAEVIKAYAFEEARRRMGWNSGGIKE